MRLGVSRLRLEYSSPHMAPLIARRVKFVGTRVAVCFALTTLLGAVIGSGVLSAQAVGATDSVWVNTSSRVYHCPGTRYFGATARGRFLSEASAVAAGYRAAYGKGCGQTQVLPLAAKGASGAPASGKVWINTSSSVYHCPGSRYYGTTKRGRFVSEAEAKAAGNRPAGGKVCRP